MAKLGEANTRLKQLEVALENAELEKKKAESELASAKQKEEYMNLDNKELKSRVGLFSVFFAFYNLNYYLHRVGA